MPRGRYEFLVEAYTGSYIAERSAGREGVNGLRAVNVGRAFVSFWDLDTGIPTFAGSGVQIEAFQVGPQAYTMIKGQVSATSVVTEVNSTTNGWHDLLLNSSSDDDVNQWLATQGGAPSMDVGAWGRMNPLSSKVFYATTYGIGEDNPVAPNDVPGAVLTDQQRARSIAVWLEDNATHPLTQFQVRYAITQCCTTGRNFLFAGISEIFMPACASPPPPPVPPPVPPPPAPPVTCNDPALSTRRSFNAPPCINPYTTSLALDPCTCTTSGSAVSFCIDPMDVNDARISPSIHPVGETCGDCANFPTVDSCYVYPTTNGAIFWGTPWASARRCHQTCHPTACVSLDCTFLGTRDYSSIAASEGACETRYADLGGGEVSLCFPLGGECHRNEPIPCAPPPSPPPPSPPPPTLPPPSPPPPMPPPPSPPPPRPPGPTLPPPPSPPPPSPPPPTPPPVGTCTDRDP